MAYTIDRYNNTTLTVIEDGTIDQTTDLKLVGRNYAGYGEIQNENFVFLLENFSGANPPPKAVSGQVWFDSATKKLKFYDGSKFRTTGGAEVSSSTPAGLTEGDFWWDTANEQLYAYTGTDFILVGPQDAGEGVTQMQSRTIRDTLGTVRSVIVSLVDDEVIHIISPNQFTIDSSDSENAIPGFDVVQKGITLKNTINSTNGVTSSSHRFWGTVSNSERLGGVLASDYIVSNPGSPTVFTELVQMPDAGCAIGDSNDLKIKIENDNQAVIANEIGEVIIFRAKQSGGTIKNPLRMLSNSLIPGLQGDGVTTESVTLGSNDHQFSNVYATNFIGTASTSSTLKVSGQERSGSTSATANTVAVRDSSGDVFANLFRGVAIQASYADLAEKYTTAEELPYGTAVAVCAHPEHEIEPASAKDYCIGVISTDPAVKMNSEAEGQYVGLRGRVPVRVKGPVSKGMPVYAWEDGVCTIIASTAFVGIALETNNEESEKLVECVLKT